MHAPVAIVGGGLSGLSLAHALHRRGIAAVVLEAAERPGGTIGTGRDGSWQWETGPTGVLDREGALGPLCCELGLSDRLIQADDNEKNRYVYTRGRLWPVKLSPAMVLGGPLPFSGRLRLLLEPLSGRARTSDESIASFGRRHLGQAAVRHLLDPMVTGIYAGDVEQLSLGACFPRMAALESRSRSLVLGALGAMRRAKAEGRTALGARLTSFVGGMQTLTDALGNRLGSRLHLAAKVDALDRVPGGWRLALPGGTLTAAKVVLCLPAPAAAALVAARDAPAQAALGAIDYAPVTVVHLGFVSAALAGVPRGFGFLAASAEGLPILGAVFASMIFPGRAPDQGHLITCMIGGMHQAASASLDDAAILARARQGLGAALGIDAEPSFHRIVRWAQAIPQYTLGHAGRVAVLEQAEQRHAGLYFGGNALRGVSVADCLKQGELLADRIAGARA